MMDTVARANQQQAVAARAVDYLVQSFSAASGSGPVLYGPDNRPMPPAQIHYTKRAAGNQGSLRNWQPRRLLNDDQVVRQRETIQARISDLVGSDPHAAGVVNSFPQTVIGSGLTPYPSIDENLLGITRDQADQIETAQRLAWSRFYPNADVSGRMHFGQLQFLWEKCLMQYGESLTLVHMRRRPGRRYRLCFRNLNPMRMKTPTDKRNAGNIYDGVEIDKSGTPTHAWIKIVESGKILSDHSRNFARIPVRRGHRWMVLHDFIAEDPEQYRGTSPLASCIKGFKDLSDFLNAELVSNVVTAAFALFIELQGGQNPFDMANNMSDFYDVQQTAAGGQEKKNYYQELNPGAIYYGNTGEKPHPISASRPGTTFEPFVREIKKSFAHGLGVPYPVLFKDVDGVSHAGFRSAMLEAWRVYTFRRNHHGQGNSQKAWTMLQEEAFLNGDLPVSGGTDRFYRDIDAICACDWYGPPKGDIEPYKQAKSDFLQWENNSKTLERIILEGGGNPAAVIRQVEKEKKDLVNRGIYSQQSQSGNDSELSGASASAEDIADAVVDRMEEKKNGS
ncbi:MAG: phage portal protein [Desulfobacteraceae bacterium]|nr:phage portal protein [Desulfobacteraceae bacterium]